jgi:uncharacterized protein (TIGR02099 family)
MSWRARCAVWLHWRNLIRLPLHLPRLCLHALWVAFFVVAIAFLLLRHVVAPQIAQQRERIEQSISQELGLKVQIAALQANWNGLRPELSIQGFRVFDKENRVALELPRVEVSVAWSSVLHQRLTLHRLEIVKPDLTIRRQADGSLFIAGLKIESTGGGSSSGFGDFVLAQDQILIRDARVTWADEQRDAPALTLERVSLRLENFAGSHRFALRASPPAAYSANLDLRGDLRGEGFKRLEDWRGTLYLALDEADLAVWQKWLDYPLALPRGRGGLRAWVKFDGKQINGLTADVALADVSMRFAKKLPMLDLASLQGHLNLTADKDKIAFVADRLSLATRDGVHIGPTRIGLDYTMATAASPSRGKFVSGDIDVRMLAQLAAYMPLPPETSRRLAEAQPAGRIKHVELDWQGGADKIGHFAVDARLEAISLKPVEGLPGVDGMSIDVHGNERGGNYRLSMRDGWLHLPAALTEGDVPVDRLDVSGRWGYEKPRSTDPERLTLRIDSGKLSNPHIPEAEVFGYWQAREKGSGFLALTAQGKQVGLENLWRYMPLHTSRDVPEWMHAALKGGFAEDVRFQISGDLDQFPYNKSPGVFRLECRLADAKIETFAPGWPGTSATQGSLVLDRQRLTILINKGMYQGVTVYDTKVEIPDLMEAGKQVLTVDGKARGATSDVLAYVNASRLGETAGSFTREVRSQGSGDLRLHIDVPLHESRNTTVKGDYRFAANTLKLIPSLPEFADASGTLGFTERGLSLSGTEAVFLGKRLRASGVTEADGTMRFDAQGAITVAGLRRLVANPGWNHLSGETGANVTIRVRHALTEITVDSNFIGISSDLAQPLAKEAGERWPVRFSLRIDGREGDASLQSWRVRLDSRLDAAWVEQCRDVQCTFTRGAIAVGEDAVLPERGWNISGSAKSADVAVWQPVIDEVLSSNGDEGSGSGSDLAVSAKVDELLVAGHRFTKVAARAMRHEGIWTVHLESPEAAGDISWQGSGFGSLRGRLTRLFLQPVQSAPADAAASAAVPGNTPQTPWQPPAMDVVVDDFRLRNMNLGRLTLLAANDDKLWVIKHLALEAPDMDLQGQGDWLAGRGTQLEFKLLSENAGSMLGHFGLANSVKKGKLDFEGNLAWGGMPYAPDYPSMTGELGLKASNGAFIEMEPGPIGRLLGIMSLQALPRRLMGNFDDVIAKGFAFATIQGDMHVEGGVLHMTHDLKIQGAAARVFISGSTDLDHQEHNLTMRVQPTMSETVSLGVIAGQLAVGVTNPALGIGLYLGQKILRDPVEKIFSYDLDVTGPWSDPKVEKKAERLEDRLDAAIPFPANSAPEAPAEGVSDDKPE